MNKYRNRKIIYDNINFASRKEGSRYLQLKFLQKNKEISQLRLQVTFELQPKFKRLNGEKERSIKYIADFTYYNSDDNFVVEDVKGIKTSVYSLKRKMLLFKYSDIIFIET